MTFEVHDGEVVALLGANGAGKSTALKAIMGLVRLTAGTVSFDGEDVTGQRPERLVARGLTLSPEGRRVFGRLTVEENLRLGACTRSSARYERIRRSVVEHFPVLERKSGDRASLLSGGEQQQLAIGRALMSEPRLLMLDEPSLGLAPLIVDEMFDLMAELRRAGVTILVVEQNVGRTLELADRAYVISTGRIVLTGSGAELLRSSDVEEAYLGLA